MAYEIELAQSVYERLEKVADELDMPVASLLDDIVRAWLKKDHKRTMEDDSEDEEYDDDADEPED